MRSRSAQKQAMNLLQRLEGLCSTRQLFGIEAFGSAGRAATPVRAAASQRMGHEPGPASKISSDRFPLQVLCQVHSTHGSAADGRPQEFDARAGHLCIQAGNIMRIILGYVSARVLRARFTPASCARSDVGRLCQCVTTMLTCASLAACQLTSLS